MHWSRAQRAFLSCAPFQASLAANPIEQRYSLSCAMMRFVGKHDCHCICHAERTLLEAKGNRQTDCVAFRQFGLRQLYAQLAKKLPLSCGVVALNYQAWLLFPDKWKPIDQNHRLENGLSFLINLIHQPTYGHATLHNSETKDDVA